jgi:subtilisin-like proprotein convertase family protein
VGGSLTVQSNAVLRGCSALASLLGWPDGPPNDNIGGDITVATSNGYGCNSVQEILDSVSGPTAPSILSSSASSGQVDLTFSPATTTDTLWPINGYKAQCLAAEVTSENNTVVDIPGEGFVVSALTHSGVFSSNAIGLSIAVNITHPRTWRLTLSLESPSGTSVILWDEAVGDGTDLIGIFPTTLEPAESLDAFDGDYFNGEWQLTVADGFPSQTGTLNSWGITIRDKITATSATSPITLTGLADSQPYSCTVSAITGLGIGPASSPVSVTTPIVIFQNGFEGD